MWTDTTCVTVEEYDNPEDVATEPHIRIIKGSGCWSAVGVVSSTGQELSLADACVRPGTIAHELGHALGIWHEFSRPDRDDQVKVIWENILEGMEYNFFKKEPENDLDPGNTGYDITSLMHYDSLGFSIDYDGQLRVMMPHDVHQLTAMGQRARLQFNDIKRVNIAYQCLNVCTTSDLEKPCQNGGYQDPKNCKICRCPPGTTGDDCGGVPVATGDGMTGCGGRFYLESCSVRTLGVPTYPYPYGEESHCTWRIKTNAKGFALAFQSEPDMPCSPADTCYDFVEVKADMTRVASPGRFFCTCGENGGRIITVDDSEIMVRFSTTTLSEKGGAGKSNGFLLNVFATCNDTSASAIKNSCSVSSTGFEICGGVPVPVCHADQQEYIAPLTPTTTTSTTTTTTASGTILRSHWLVSMVAILFGYLA